MARVSVRATDVIAGYAWGRHIHPALSALCDKVGVTSASDVITAGH